jgi:phage baseplate assembly protein gpV
MSVVYTEDLVPVLRSIFSRIGEHERRLAGTHIRGKVTQVDTQKAMVRIAIGKDEDDQDVLSPWVPYKQTAGAMKFHNPPSVGQTMAIRSESGDVEQGTAEPFHWSDDNPANSTASDAHKMTFGSVTIDLTDGGLKLTCGGVTFDFTGSGFAQTGGTQTHDGHSVDKTHVHTDVVVGGDLTGPPP